MLALFFALLHVHERLNGFLKLNNLYSFGEIELIQVAKEEFVLFRSAIQCSKVANSRGRKSIVLKL